MIERYNYRGDPNTGFYATVTSGMAILPPEFKRKDFFEVDCAETFIARTRLVGMFTAGNSNAVLVPENTTERERGKLENAGIDFHVLDSRENALGNLVLANDKGVVVSSRLRDHVKEISEVLGVPAKVVDVASLSAPGVAAVTTNHGVLLHREASEEEAAAVKEALDIEDVDIGTVNMGSPYIGSGVVGTERKLLVGEDTTGPEIGRIDMTLQNV